MCYLLIHGDMPTSEELGAFDRRLRRQRSIPTEVIETIRLNKAAHPMDALRTGVSSLSTFDADTADMSREANVRKSERLTAQIATVVAAHQRLRSGQEPVAPREDLPHAANFLYMLTGEAPSQEAIDCMDLDFILHAEHGANASAFAGRVTASTESDMHSSVVSAIGTLKGPLHGGAAENVMQMVLEIGSPEKAQEYVNARQKDRNNRVMGFGHRVYKVEDPRARHMREKSRQLSQRWASRSGTRFCRRWRRRCRATSGTAST